MGTTGNAGGSTTTHIPYRDSKLTRLLQDSLSGNAKTLLILTLSLSSCHLQESIATLRFGERARKLTTAPKINTELTDVSLKKHLLRTEKQLVVLNATIAELRAEVKRKDAIILDLQTKGGNLNNPENCRQCHLLKEENEKLIIASLKADANKSSVTSRTTPVSKNKSFKLKNKNKAKVSPKGKKDIDQMTPEDIQQRFDVSRVVTVDGSATNMKADEESRCGVCRLNESETALLLKDTGEELGTYFTCDGNCGNRFHVKCAGEVGEDGAYRVPGGEWYCTSCAVEDDDSVTKFPPTLTVSPSKSVLDGDKQQTSSDQDEDEAEESYDASLSLQKKGLKSLPSGIDNEAQAQQTMARLQAEYHAMRRERNRVLNQWQHEKRLQAVSEKYREESERDRDEELITAKEVILKLQSDVLKAHKENNRLKTMNEDIMGNVDKQKQFDSQIEEKTESQTNKTPKKPTDTKEKRKSTVDSELRKKITSDIMSSQSKPNSREKGHHKQGEGEENGMIDTNKRPESALRPSPIGHNTPENATTIEATTSKFQIKSMPKLVRKSKKTGQIITSQTLHASSGARDEDVNAIPKPWLQRTQSQPSSSEMIDNVSTLVVPPRKVSTSPIRSRKEHSNSAESRRAGQRGRQQQPISNDLVNGEEITDSDSFDPDVKTSTSVGNSTDFSQSLKSPLFNSRLKNLLASVQEEASRNS